MQIGYYLESCLGRTIGMYVLSCASVLIAVVSNFITEG